MLRIITILSPTLRINYLKTIAPSLNLKTCQYLKISLGFGDWLILVMMSLHLDIKLFTDILNEIKSVSFSNSRSVSTAIDIISPSDTENELEDFPKISYRKPTKLGLKRVCMNILVFINFKCLYFQSSTSAALADKSGIDPIIVQEMIADG